MLSAKGVEPVDTPDVKDVVVEEGKPLSFTASFDVVPPFDPGDFSDIQLRRSAVTVDDDAVQATLERLRERAARFEPVEGGVAEGHTLVIDLERQTTGRRRRGRRTPTSTRRSRSTWAPRPTRPGSTTR